MWCKCAAQSTVLYKSSNSPILVMLNPSQLQHCVASFHSFSLPLSGPVLITVQASDEHQHQHQHQHQEDVNPMAAHGKAAWTSPRAPPTTSWPSLPESACRPPSRMTRPGWPRVRTPEENEIALYGHRRWGMEETATKDATCSGAGCRSSCLYSWTCCCAW